MNMKSLKRFFRQSFDKGAVLAVTFGGLYLYKQYIPDVSGMLSYGIVAVGAIEYARYIIHSQDTTAKEEYEKLLSVLHEQRSDIEANRTKLKEVGEICHHLLVNKDLLMNWWSATSLVKTRVNLLQRLLKVQLRLNHGNSQDPDEIGILRSSPNDGTLSKVKKLPEKDNQNGILSYKYMNSFSSFLCQAFDKGVVLALGICSYIYKQKYISNVPDIVSYVIITAGAVGFARSILKDVETTHVPQGAIAEYVQEAVAATVRKEISEMVEREMAKIVEIEKAAKVQEKRAENMPFGIVKKKTTEKMEEQVHEIVIQEEPEDNLGQSSKGIQRKRPGFTGAVIAEIGKKPGTLGDGLSIQYYEDIAELSRLSRGKRLEKKVEKSGEIVSEKVEGKVTEKKLDTSSFFEEMMTQKRQTEGESPMMPEDKSGILREKFPEGVQQGSKNFSFSFSLEPGKQQEVVTGEPQTTGEEKRDIVEKEKAVGEAEF